VAPFIGSFMGVVIMRLPEEQPIVVGHSICPHCKTRLAAIDLIPLLSFVLLRGRCRYCRAPIGWLHPAVELAAVAVALWAVVASTGTVAGAGDIAGIGDVAGIGNSAGVGSIAGMVSIAGVGSIPGTGGLWIDCALGWTLLTLAWIDWRCLLLPDVLTLPLLLAGLIVTLLWTPSALADHSLAAMLAYGFFRGLAWSFRRLRGRDALGGGDAKLLAAAGAWCGLAALPCILLASAVFGLLAALGLAIATRAVTSRTPIPFGPCIALAFWLAWLHPALMNGGLMNGLDQTLWGP
jgi:leader peptidase (prepilin peptidase)/N-methyltransferase